MFIYLGYKLIHPESLIFYHFTGHQTLWSVYCVKNYSSSPILMTSSQYPPGNTKDTELDS